MPTKAGYRPELALRIQEGLSQIRIYDVLFTTGPRLRAIRLAVKRELAQWHEARQKRNPSNVIDFDAAKAWETLRQVNGSKKLRPYVIV